VNAPLISDLYARKSTKDAGRSAARQERDWRADCTDAGLVHGQVFVDPDLSASRYSTKPRPDYDKLLAHVRSGDCRVVSMWEASRGSRQLAEWIGLVDLCRDRGVLIRIFADGGRTFDPRRRRDYRALADEGMDAHDETERLSERVRAGQRDAAQEGRPPGPLLYGYRRVYGAPSDDSRSGGGYRRREITQVVDEAQAAIVRRLAADTLDGEPLIKQARKLNAEGVPTASGKGRWSNVQIGRLLRHPGYVGDRVYRGEVIATGAWPAILDRDDHRRLRALLEAPGRLRNHGRHELAHQLSGAAICGGRCGTPIRTLRGTKYACRRPGCMQVAASMSAMDDVVDRLVIARLRQVDVAAVFAPAVDDAQIQKVRRELAEAREHLAGFYAEAGAGRLSARAVATVEAATLPRIDRLEGKLRRLATPPVLRELATVDVAGTWHALPVGIRREVIVALARVVLSPGGRGVRWSPWRLRESRWHGDEMAWGQRWERDGVLRQV
jgi:site-specific DNA recombinase